MIRLYQTCPAFARHVISRYFSANRQARRFYEHCGFEVIQEGMDEQTGFPQLTMKNGR